MLQDNRVQTGTQTMIVAGSIEASKAPASPVRSGPLDVVPPNLKSCPQDSKKADDGEFVGLCIGQSSER
jgi:hypothetical protein